MLDMPKGLKRYRIRMDADHALRMTCQNANCDNERNGWVTVLDLGNEKHAGAAKLIEMDSGKRFAKFYARDAEDEIERHGGSWGVDLAHLRFVVGNALPSMAVYVFFPGQACFKRHLDREVVFTRESREGAFTHSKPLEFNEDHNESAFRFYRASGRMI